MPPATSISASAVDNTMNRRACCCSALVQQPACADGRGKQQQRKARERDDASAELGARRSRWLPARMTRPQGDGHPAVNTVTRPTPSPLTVVSSAGATATSPSEVGNRVRGVAARPASAGRQDTFGGDDAEVTGVERHRRDRRPGAGPARRGSRRSPARPSPRTIRTARRGLPRVRRSTRATGVRPCRRARRR